MRVMLWRWIKSAGWVGLFALMLSASACKPSPQTYDVKGTVREVYAARDKVRIAHERIPGYMEPMTMVFDVKDTNELAGIQERDIVRFRMVVTADDGWIEDVKKVGQAPPSASSTAAPAAETTRVVKNVEELGVGDVLPNYQFTNQFNQVVQTDEFRGRALALTFIFTRCPFPVYCPRMSTNFTQVLTTLKRLPGAPTNWHLLTVSFDPQHDTPAVLRAYAERYRYDPRHWTFVTGSRMEISALGDHFGLLFWQPNSAEDGNLSHNLRTVVLDSQGRVRKIYTNENWSVDDLVAEIIKAARFG
jgi:protein SCO1